MTKFDIRKKLRQFAKVRVIEGEECVLVKANKRVTFLEEVGSR